MTPSSHSSTAQSHTSCSAAPPVKWVSGVHVCGGGGKCKRVAVCAKGVGEMGVSVCSEWVECR